MLFGDSKHELSEGAEWGDMVYDLFVIYDVLENIL